MLSVEVMRHVPSHFTVFAGVAVLGDINQRMGVDYCVYEKLHSASAEHLAYWPDTVTLTVSFSRILLSLAALVMHFK